MAKISDFVNVIKCMNGTLLHCKYNVKSDSAILSIYSDEFDDYFDLVNIKICDEDIYCIPCVSIFGKYKSFGVIDMLSTSFELEDPFLFMNDNQQLLLDEVKDSMNDNSFYESMIYKISLWNADDFVFRQLVLFTLQCVLEVFEQCNLSVGNIYDDMQCLLSDNKNSIYSYLKNKEKE